MQYSGAIMGTAMSILARRSVPVLALVLGAGCPKGPVVQSALEPAEQQAPSTPAASEPPAAEDPAVAVAMHERFAAITEARDAIIYGDAERSRSLARGLADQLAKGGGPPSWEVPLQGVATQADAVADAKALDDTAAAVARLAGACGSCHERTDTEPTLSTLDPPPQGKGAEAVMGQHQWAVDRMWEGLVGPSSDHWVRGTSMFVALPRCEGSNEATCTRIRRLVGQAHVQETPEARADLYGRLLTTCSACHERRPGQAP